MNVIYSLRHRSPQYLLDIRTKKNGRASAAAGGLNSAFGRRSFSLLLMRIISTSLTRLREAHRFSDFRANRALLLASSWDTCNSTLQRAPG